MLTHYLKIAFRNMRKYKNQTLISVIGLAVGFTCFALATLWIRYEMSYDGFHKNAKNMYVVYRLHPWNPTAGYVNNLSPLPLAPYLKETFPEIANATFLSPASPRGIPFVVDDVDFHIQVINVDSSFFHMFGIKILEGNKDFLIPVTYPAIRKYAITQEKARQLYGNENPIGKKLGTFNVLGERNSDWYNEICAVVSGMPKQSNYPFEFIGAYNPHSNPNYYWSPTAGHAIIELFPETNLKSFEKKLYKHDTGEGRGDISRMMIKPLTKMRYIDLRIPREVKFQYIFIFAISGLLVVLCSLFNYLALFVSRFRIRQKELALRMVCGASGRSLLTMLSVEFILTILFAIVLGCMMIQFALKPFLAMSEIKMGLHSIYRESFMYIAGIILISFLVFGLVLYIFQRRSLNLSIRQSNKKLFRKVSVIVQLLISVGFAFCTIVILKQMYFLHHSGELGFTFKNRGSVQVWGGNADAFAHLLKQIPEITDVVDAKGMTSLLPQRSSGRREFDLWDDKPADIEQISLVQMFVSPELIDFYDLRLMAGEMITDPDPESLVLLNEAAVKVFGWHDPVGKQFADSRFPDSRFTVKGVIKNVFNSAPTVEVSPTCYLKPWTERESASMGIGGTTFYGRSVMFKYREGMWKSCKKKIEQLIEKEYGNTSFLRHTSITNAEEVYDSYLKSERVIIKVLSFVSVICILICVFGFVSLVSLTCEERRKSIAIRKINGATAGDILAMFAKEYFLLLIIGAAIAFTAGYFIMQRWLEHYVIQTNIPAWIYLSIMCALAMVIVLCVGWQVYKSSIENPAKVVKSE